MAQRKKSISEEGVHSQVLSAITRSHGLSVEEIRERVAMSYMGVKAHCITLEKAGWVEALRRPVPRGRPEKIYRTTLQGHEQFPGIPGSMTLELLDAAERAFGRSAAEKILVHAYQQRIADLRKDLAGLDFQSRINQICTIRDAEGRLTRCSPHPEEGFLLEEFHQPLSAIGRRHPILARLEQELLEKILGARIQRLDDGSQPHYVSYQILA